MGLADPVEEAYAEVVVDGETVYRARRPATDDAATLCLVCGSAERDCGCSPALLCAATAVISRAASQGEDPVRALAVWAARGRPSE